MIAFLRRLGLPKVLVAVLVGLIVGGGSYAIGAQPSTKKEDAGVHGGPNARFHDASECSLVDGRTLDGNWTHGDYVSAVAAHDPSKVREAAHSRCGKPDHAAKRHGKPDKARKSESDETSEPAPERSESPLSTPTASSPSPTPTDSSPEPSPTESSPEPTASPSPTVSPSPTGSGS